MSQELPYKVGEKILCYHGPMIYEAKVCESWLKGGLFFVWDAVQWEFSMGLIYALFSCRLTTIFLLIDFESREF